MTRNLEPLLDPELQRERLNSAVMRQIPCAGPTCCPGQVEDIRYPDIQYRSRAAL